MLFKQCGVDKMQKQTWISAMQIGCTRIINMVRWHWKDLLHCKEFSYTKRLASQAADMCEEIITLSRDSFLMRKDRCENPNGLMGKSQSLVLLLRCVQNLLLSAQFLRRTCASHGDSVHYSLHDGLVNIMDLQQSAEDRLCKYLCRCFYH